MYSNAVADSELPVQYFFTHIGEVASEVGGMQIKGLDAGEKSKPRRTSPLPFIGPSSPLSSACLPSRLAG